MVAPIRVFLADDHRVVRAAVSRALQDAEDITVVGQAADGDEAVRLVPRVRPDVVLMDISMPRVNGIEATRAICSKCPDVRIIGFSMYDGSTMAEAMRAAGALSYVSKGSDPEALIATIRRVCGRAPEQSGSSGGEIPESPDARQEGPA